MGSSDVVVGLLAWISDVDREYHSTQQALQQARLAAYYCRIANRPVDFMQITRLHRRVELLGRRWFYLRQSLRHYDTDVLSAQPVDVA
jgi:hypothetical protein